MPIKQDFTKQECWIFVFVKSHMIPDLDWGEVMGNKGSFYTMYFNYFQSTLRMSL